MPKTRSNSDPPLLRAILVEIEKATQGKRAPVWVSATVAEVNGASFDQIDAALALLKQRGWIETGGDPPHSVAITATGRKRGLTTSS